MKQFGLNTLAGALVVGAFTMLPFAVAAQAVIATATRNNRNSATRTSYGMWGK